MPRDLYACYHVARASRCDPIATRELPKRAKKNTVHLLHYFPFLNGSPSQHTGWISRGAWKPPKNRPWMAQSIVRGFHSNSNWSSNPGNAFAFLDAYIFFLESFRSRENRGIRRSVH